MKNKTTNRILIGILIIILMFGGYIGLTYNSLVSLENEVEQKLSDIDTVLQRRLELIPNVVNTAKKYLKHEEDILTTIATARSQLLNSNSTDNEKVEANKNLQSGLDKLLAITESYPDLKATQIMEDLITELEGSQNRITVSQKEYNKSVTKYNNKVRKFPSNFVANIFGYEKKELFKADEEAKKAPTVDFTE